MAEFSPPTRGTRRFNISVPAADDSTIRWFVEQENKSVSIRTIIHEYIQRYGYTDPLCRPVAQGPKRGRPRLIDSDDDFDFENESVQETIVDESQPEPEPPIESPVEQTPSPAIEASPTTSDEIPLGEDGLPDLNWLMGPS